MALAVEVAAGSVQIAASTVVVAGDTLVLSDADTTDPRFDLVVSDDAGVVSVVDGTPSTNASFPAIPADSVVLAAVYVPANEDEITADNIVDKRVFVVAAP